jgi:glycerol-3-phosphate acyltransferase PlsY
MQFWLCPLIAFLMGSIPFGLLIGRMRGIDIRQHGSGNIGATNVLRVMGKAYGIPCLLLDALKGFVPVVIATHAIQIHGRPVMAPFDLPAGWVLTLGEADALRAQAAHIVTALCAVLGHNHSPWTGFRGGKGIATSAGVLAALMPFGLVVLLAVWGVLFLTTRYVSVASIGAALSLPLLTLWGAWIHGRLQDGTWNKPLFVFAVLVALLAVWTHRSNLSRLRQGTEHRFARKRT